MKKSTFPALFILTVSGLLILSFFAIATEPAAALDTYWLAGTASWHDPLNWDNGIPTASDDTYIDNGGTAQITADAGSYRFFLGYDDFGAVEQTGGTYTVENWLRLGENSSSSGTYNLSAGELSVNCEYIGYYGTGEFNQSGGIHTIGDGIYDDLYIGYYTGSSGTYNLSGMGELTAKDDETIGIYGTGEFNQTGGTNTINDGLYLGHYTGSSGTYNLSGDGVLSAKWEHIGCRSTGEFIQTGGTNTVNRHLYIGYYSGSSGTYNLGGTGQLSASFEDIGYEGTGEFSQSGGTHTVDWWLCLGRYGSSGTYNLSGDGVLSANEEYVGASGTGEFTQSGGTNTITSYLRLGCQSGFSGRYNLSGDGVLSANEEYVGYEGAGEFNQTGGTNTVNGYLYLGYSSGSSGTYNLSGGFLEAGDLDINNGWMDIDVSEIDLFAVHGDKVGLLDGYILDGKIFDSSSTDEICAVYDADNDWTTFGIGAPRPVIPEPTALLLLAPGLFGIVGLLRRKFQ